MEAFEGSAMNAFDKVVEFGVRLDSANIAYDLAMARADTIMFSIAVPGERWEVEFCRDGSVEVEVFRSDGHILGESSLAGLFEAFSDP